MTYRTKRVILESEGQEPREVSLSEFIADNEFDSHEAFDIRHCIREIGRYVGGGGAGIAWRLRAIR